MLARLSLQTKGSNFSWLPVLAGMTEQLGHQADDVINTGNTAFEPSNRLFIEKYLAFGSQQDLRTKEYCFGTE